MNKKLGRIIGKINPYLREHELEMINILLEKGFDIEMIPERRERGVHTPDIKMLGLDWEMKSPKANTSDIIRNTLRDAQKQSENIIISLKRTNRPDVKCIREVKSWFDGHHSTRNIWIILKNKKIIKIAACKKKA